MLRGTSTTAVVAWNRVGIRSSGSTAVLADVHGKTGDGLDDNSGIIVVVFGSSTSMSVGAMVRTGTQHDLRRVHAVSETGSV